MGKLKFWIVVGLVLFALWPVGRFVAAWYWMHQATKVFSVVPSAAVVQPVARVAEAAKVFNDRQAARLAEIRGQALRLEGSPARPLRQGERCVGGTVVSSSTVSGVPTYTQVLEGGLRISCQ